MPLKKIASWTDSKYITMSSLLFTLPILLNEKEKHMIMPSCLLFMTSMVSANFWRNPLYDWRRTMDLYFAKLSFSYFFINGFLYIPYPHKWIALLNTCNIAYCYHQSNSEYEKKNKNWIWYHVGFHSALTFNIYYILKYFPRKYPKLTLYN